MPTPPTQHRTPHPGDAAHRAARDVPRGTSRSSGPLADALTPAHDSPDASPVALLAGLESRLEELSLTLDAEQRHAELGLLAAAVAHEINNALTPVIAYSQLAAQRPDDTTTLRNALRRTLEGATRAAAISRTILDLARCNTPDEDDTTAVDATNLLDLARRARNALLPVGGQAINIDEAHIHPAAVDSTASAPQARPDTHPRTLDAAIPPLWLEHALQNILLNALRATANQSNICTVFVEFLAEMTPPDAPPGRVGLRVRDTGPGFPAGRLRPVNTGPGATPADDADHHRVAVQNGGLGLRISASLIERAGGVVRIATPAAGPTTLDILLPRAA